MPRNPKRDPITGKSKCCSLPPKQVARRSTTGAPPVAIHYHRTTLKPFKEGIRNRGRYFRF